MRTRLCMCTKRWQRTKSDYNFHLMILYMYKERLATMEIGLMPFVHISTLLNDNYVRERSQILRQFSLEIIILSKRFANMCVLHADLLFFVLQLTVQRHMNVCI